MTSGRRAQAASRASYFLAGAAQKAMLEVKKVMRRLHAPSHGQDRKEVLRPFGRKVGKIAHANPLATLDAVAAQACFSLLSIKLWQPSKHDHPR